MIKYIYLITASALFILKAELVASAGTFYRALEEDTVWIKACSDACREFRGVFRKFTNDINTSNWIEARQAFTTCQWRCYRCSLTTGVAGMEAIESISSDMHNSQSLDIIKKYKRDINLSAYICHDKWIASSSLGCSRNPVEAVDSSCRS